MNQVNPELIAAIVTEIVKQLETTGSVRLPGSSTPDFAVPAPAK